jgi:hypothetical protein
VDEEFPARDGEILEEIDERLARHAKNYDESRSQGNREMAATWLGYNRIRSYS